MKVISLRQPWATLVVVNRKRIETRSWATTYRGPLLIHAGKKFMEGVEPSFQDPFFSDLVAIYGIRLPGFPFGAIIGKVEMVGCYKIGGKTAEVNIYDEAIPAWVHYEIPPPEPELSFGDYTPGRYAWLFQKPVRFKRPILWKGLLGLFNVPDEAVKGVE